MLELLIKVLRLQPVLVLCHFVNETGYVRVFSFSSLHFIVVTSVKKCTVFSNTLKLSHWSVIKSLIVFWYSLSQIYLHLYTIAMTHQCFKHFFKHSSHLKHTIPITANFEQLFTSALALNMRFMKAIENVALTSTVLVLVELVCKIS